MSKFPDFAPTTKQRTNLLTLADYLDALPEGYEGFRMEEFQLDQYGDDVGIEERLIVGPTNECGACACAIGHGPSAGIRVDEFNDFDWWGYSRRVFGCAPEAWPSKNQETVGNYLFGVNNPDDPKAAAARIREVLG